MQQSGMNGSGGARTHVHFLASLCVKVTLSFSCLTDRMSEAHPALQVRSSLVTGEPSLHFAFLC